MMAGLCLLLIDLMGHLPELKLDCIIISRWCQLSEGWKPHLNHASSKLSSAIKFPANVLCDFLSCLGEGILSRHHIVNGALDVCTLALKLGLPVATALVVIALSMVRLGSHVATLAGPSGWGASTSWIA